MIAKIRALDTLFFKDGKPFAMGQETWADGIFPPHPSVIFGALRTMFISQHPSPFSQKAIRDSESLTIRGNYYRIGNANFFPMPKDLAEPKKNKEKETTDEVIRLQAYPFQTAASNYPCKMVLVPENEVVVEEVENGYIEESNFLSYLIGDNGPFKIKKLSDFVQSEPKTGIGRNNHTHTASDAMLYRVGMRRTSSFELLVNFDWSEELTIQDSSFLIKLGAENKMAEVRMTSHKPRVEKSGIKEYLEANRFKLYLSTPAIFKTNDWHPDLKRLNINANLVAAAIGKPLHIGGFDIKKNEPKKMFKAVPAGSVFYYETDEPTDKLLDTLFEVSVSEEMQQQGFGIAYIGNW